MKYQKKFIIIISILLLSILFFVLQQKNKIYAKGSVNGHYYSSSGGSGSTSFTCSDHLDNDKNGFADGQDSKCHSDGNPLNPYSYTANSNAETDNTCHDNIDNDNNGVADLNDPSCHTDGDVNNYFSWFYNYVHEGPIPTCEDSIDNNGDGTIDGGDPACHTDGDPTNPSSYDPNRSESSTISGSVFNDTNKNGILDTWEQSYNGGNITIDINPQNPSTTVVVQSDGTYTITNLSQGTYTVSYTSPLPTGYQLIAPKNGPPPSYQVTVGSNCAVPTNANASCKGGSISNLNFAISNSTPWYQFYDGSVRMDNGITDKIPTNPIAPAYMLATKVNATNPGTIIMGQGTADFGQGNASSTNTVAGGSVYPESYKENNGTELATSYQNLLSKAKNANLTITDLTTIPGCEDLTNCTLAATLPAGVYQAKSDLTLNQATFSGNQQYIFLINGTLTVRGAIQTAVGTTTLFSALNDIVVDKNVKASANSYPVP